MPGFRKLEEEDVIKSLVLVCLQLCNQNDNLFCLFIATVLYDTNFQILDFYLRGKGDSGQERVKRKFCDLWR